MNAVLDFPEIIDPPTDEEVRAAAAQIPSHIIIVNPAKTTELAKVDLKALALARFGSWKPEAEKIVAKFKGVIFTDLGTVKGYEALTKAIAEVRAPRFAAQNVSKASKSELAAVSKAVGTEEAAVIAFLDATEKELVAQKDAEDERREAKKLADKAIEDARIAKHESGIVVIRSYLTLAQGHPSDAIARGIAKLEAMTFGAEWEEFAVKAANAQCDTVDALRALMLATKAAEDEKAARIAETERLALVAEEQRVEAKKLKEARELIAKQQKDAADKLAADQAALAKEKADWLASIAPPPVAQTVAVEPIEPTPAPIAAPASAPVETPPVEIIGSAPLCLDPGKFGTFAVDSATGAHQPDEAVYTDPDDLETLLRDCLEFVDMTAEYATCVVSDECAQHLRVRIANLKPRLLAALED